jgi:hypothetical protein
MSFSEQLIPLLVHGLDQGASIRSGAKLAADAADVHVDAAIVTRMSPAQGAQRQIVLADRRADEA